MKLLIVCTHLVDQVVTRKDLLRTLREELDLSSVSCVAPIVPRNLNFREIDEVYEYSGRRGSMSLFGNISSFISLIKIIRKEKADVIFTIGLLPRIFVGFINIFYGLKIATLVNGRGRFYIKGGSFFRSIIFLLARFIAWNAYKHYDLIIVQNLDDEKFFGDLPKPKVVKVSGSGVDLMKFSPSSKVSTEWDFLFVGRFLRSKGVLHLLDSIKLMRSMKVKLRCCIVLSDLERGDIDESILGEFENNGSTVLLSPQNIPSLLARAKYAVLPSHQEGCSRFLLEASASGVPLITTDVIGCHDLCSDENHGWKVTKDDVTGLAVAMLHALQLPEPEYKVKSCAVRRTATEKYDIAVVNAQMVTAFQEMLK